ncbi:MAG: hypothetical protein R3305_06940, partial [Gammaproteobacteria bacterium]|nr:hypothetical protein [Gammaproteobacteria bacterium]
MTLLIGATAHADLSNEHEITIGFETNSVDTDASLGAWTDGGFGKLRYGPDETGFGSARLSFEYRGQLSSQLFGRAVVDYIDDAEQKIGPTELYLEWRPLPKGPKRQRWRFGAFYP